MGKGRGLYMGKPEGKIPLGWSRHRWENNMNIQKVPYGSMNMIEMDHDRYRWRVLVNVVIKLRF
jgi:hypothetical protein